jgi:cell wall-associated NlpC family hydrolase
MGQPREGAQCAFSPADAEAQEHPLLSKQYPIELVQQDIVPPVLAKPANFRRKSNVLSVAVCALVLPGLLATVALPAYGATPSSADGSNVRNVSSDPQTLAVAASDTTTVSIARDTIGFVAPPPVVHVSRARFFGAVNLSGVAGIAARYLGVPYVYGGSSPAGFDCSGFVKFVYSQVGVSLPHSAAEQGRMGTRIPVSAAVSGDVVVLDGGSHVGIYIGGGRMIDAPEPGRVVSVDAIYDANYYIVRF